MDASKLVPNDPRVAWQATTTRGHTYSYQVVEPQGAPKDTVLLLHGFPDLSFGWRNQAPYLASLGYRVVIPDMLGYGRTDAPADPTEYTFKKLSDDIAAISAAVLGTDGGKVILGGHDWGGVLAWRVALWHSEIVKALLVVCTPYAPPSNGTYYPLEALISNGILTQFKYQLQLAGEEAESHITDEKTIRQFLRTMFGGATPSGERGFENEKGILFDKYMDVGDTPLMSPTDMDYRVQEFVRSGMKGPLNWYRTRKLNFDDEVELANQGKTKIEVPTLFVAATYDTSLPPKMSEGMEAHFTLPLARGEVAASHWALEHAPAEVNACIKGFLETLENGGSKL